MRKLMMMLVAMAMISAVAVGQEKEKVAEKLTKKELRKLKREEAKQAFEKNKAYGMDLIADRDFVLKADRIYGKRSPIIVVDQNVNFIKINGDQMVIQYGLLSQLGVNGLGGTTFEGTISQLDTYDLGAGKAYNVRIQFSTPALNGVATVHINVRGDKAQASLWSNGRVLNFEGNYGGANEQRVAQGINGRVILAN